MNDSAFATLVRPQQSQVTIDPEPKQCPSDGFNYPTFRLLNKLARVALSQPVNPQPSYSYHLLATSNLKGWFVAATSFDSSPELSFSTLESLRSAFEAAKDESENSFTPKRTLSLQGKPNIIALACNDTRLLVGLEEGSLFVYDTAALFTEGSNEVQALHVSLSTSQPARQIAPNPGSEPNLMDLVAVVRDDGTVQLLNMQLEPQGGWAAGDPLSAPVSVAWSPKGKHLAIGLRTGDILTFALNNKTSPNKHIPPTCNGALVALNWTGPGHTFRTSYAPHAPSATEPAQHIITLDTKSSTATYYALTHPFALPDRPQRSYVFCLPRFDEDPSSTEDKALYVIGDASSVDLEVVGHVGNQWYQESQEYPLSLPLDKNLDDTILVALEADLTDKGTGKPIMYAYLNDGTIQAWHVEHSKSYVGMITDAVPASSTMDTTPQVHSSAFVQQPSSSAFGQPSNVSGFGQASIFGQPAPATTAFGQPSAFGQSSFGQQSSSTFGQPSTFGKTSSTNAFDGFASTGASPFGQTAPTGPAFGGTQSAFGGTSSGAFGLSGGGAFGAFGSSGSTNVFGQGSFGVPKQPATAAPASQPEAQSSAPSFTREASMSDSTPSFGGLSLGGGADDVDTKAKSGGGIFGSFGSAPFTTTTLSSSTFGDTVKPATGFGAFNNLQTQQTPQPAQNEPPKPSDAFGQSAFGQSGFGQSGFGKPGFGQSSFGQSGFGKPATPSAVPTPSSGGFSAFASSTPASFAAATQKTAAPATSAAPALSSGGFGAFASSTPASFATAAQKSAAPATSSFASPSSGGFGAFASAATAGFGTTKLTADATQPTQAKSAFGGNAFGASPLVNTKPSTPPISTPEKPSVVASPPSSPEPILNARSPSPNDESPPPAPAKSTSVTSGFGAFGNLQSTPSAFKPASGFGAFGTPSTPDSSPFFKKPEEKKTPVSAFANLGSGNMSGSSSPGTPLTAPAFGATSLIGGSKSVFAPPTPPTPTPMKGPTVGGFGAFSGSSPSFGAAVGAKKSFSDLLKADTDSKDPVKPSTSTTVTSATNPQTIEVKLQTSTSIFGSPPSTGRIPASNQIPSALDKKNPTLTVKEEPEPPVSVFSVLSKEKEKPSYAAVAGHQEKKEITSGTISDASLSNISASSAGSSFVEVNAETGDERSGEDGQLDEDGDKDNSDFLSDSAGSHESSEAEESGSEESEDDESVDDESDEDRSARSESPPLEPTAVPLPSSRSPSATPQPQQSLPKIQVTPSPSPSDGLESLSLGDEQQSTTPPGTPTKEVKQTSAATAATVTPISTTPSPFGIGLGRPSTRPTRSSPLASAPVSGDDEGEHDKDDEVEEEEEEEEEEEKEDAELKPSTKPPASPRPVFGVLPLKTDAPLKSEPDEEGQSTSPTSKRPKTPPLLSSFGGSKTPVPSTPVLAHAIPPGQRPETTPAVSSLKVVPLVLPFSPSTPPTTSTEKGALASTSTGLFGKPAVFAPPPLTATKPAATPALTSLFGTAPTPGSNPASNIAPSSTGFNMPQFSLKGATSTAFSLATGVDAKSLTPPPQGLFGKQPAASPTPPQGLFSKPPVASPPTQSLFGAQSPSQSPFGAGKASAPGFNGFGQSPFPSAQTNFFGGQASASPAPPVFKPQPVPTTISASAPELTMEEGMQKECAMLISSLNKELEDLRLLAQQTSQRRATLGKSLGGSRKKEDLGNTSKWGLNDAAQFGQLLKQYEQDLVELKEKREKQKQMLRELQRSMLKAGTRREEIVRFNKAKNDAEFAKMLRARTLGPEHLETQTQLRRNIRIMRDRIQKLEVNLQASKKKLAQSTTGKPGFRAPSLDTINRTYRNIDLAIQQQSADVSDLASRISKLKISGSSSSLIARDARLPDVVSKRPYNVTPHVAITTAAALNAERSANRLKRALLSVRKEPLLNTKAVTAPAPPVAFSTPQKAPGFGFQTPPSSLFAVPSSYEALETPLPSWNLPEDNFNPSTPQATRRGAGSGQKKHSSVALKRSPGMSPTPAAPAFDWGPLPSFNAPLNSLAMGVKVGSPGGGTSGSNGESSLGGSWIKDGFGKKA